MEKPATIPADKAATVRLALPRRPTDSPSGEYGAIAEPCLEQIQVIETGCSPKVEAALLKDLLRRSPGLEQTLADPCEVQGTANALAAANAYKHRLHALRCEFVNVRLSIRDLETRLDQSSYQREVLQKRVHFLEEALEQMRSSRAWKLAEKCSLWSQRLRRVLRKPFSREP